jgi:hypothetical protein
MPIRGSSYAPEAYSPDGVLWWHVTKHPGKNVPFGGERRIAAWLAFHVHEGGTFTMRDVRAALGRTAGIPERAEQLNRRLRNLRPDGWEVGSYKSDSSLPVDRYRVERVGWHPGCPEPRPRRQAISSGLRRRVLERDGRRCVVCGIGQGEPYPGEPRSAARITAGHRIPSLRGTSAHSLDELQTECDRCNETVRDEIPDPLRLAELLPDLRRLNRDERDQLLRWLTAGHRLRSRLDEVHDRVRMLSPVDRQRVADTLHSMLGQQAP